MEMGEGEQQRKQKHRESVKRAEELVESNMKGRDASHDASHAYRVRDLALSLAREEGLDDPFSPRHSPHALLVVELAALLHDIGDYKYTKNLEEDTVIVKKFLEEEGFDDGTKEKVLAIIKSMGFKNEVARMPSFKFGLESGIVQDADRLDAIGAIGIARCFTFGGSRNNILHDPDIPPRVNLSKEAYMSKDGKTTINHFHEKLLKLKNLLKTEAGKRRAQKRHKFMEDFLHEFYEEWSGRA